VGGKYFSVIHTSCFNLSKASIFVTQLTENWSFLMYVYCFIPLQAT
jgi:hypothetical protein